MRAVISNGKVYWHYAYKKQAIKRKEELKEEGISAWVFKTTE